MSFDDEYETMKRQKDEIVRKQEVRAVGENPTIPTRTAQNRLMYSPEEAK